MYFFVTSLTYLCYVLLRLLSALRIGTQNVSCLGAVVLAPRRMLSAKGNRLAVHRSLFQSFLGLLTSNNIFQLLSLCSELWGTFVYHPSKKAWKKVAVACFVVCGGSEGSRATPRLG